MLVFLIGCVCLGLWAPPKKNFAYAVAGLALLLVIFYLIKPDHL
jgi:hypothetical protein